MTYKERIQRAFPGWRQLLRKSTPMIRSIITSGAAAGTVAVAEIKKGDQIISVFESAASSAILTDRTSEFVLNTDPGWLVRTDGYIDNTDGTSTSGDLLIVTWLAWAE